MTSNHRADYSEAMRQRAFLLWMWEADSNAEATARALAAQEAADARLDGRDPQPTPNGDTIRAWMRKEHWTAQRHQLLIHNDTYKHLLNDAIGRNLILLEKAQTRHAELLDLPTREPILDPDGQIIGEKPSAALPTIYKAIEGVYALAKLIGRPAEEGAVPQLQARRAYALAEAQRSPDEAAAANAARLAAYTPPADPPAP